MQKDVVMESCVCAMAELSKKEKTPEVCRAEGALEQMLFDLRGMDESEIDYEAYLGRIDAFSAAM